MSRCQDLINRFNEATPLDKAFSSLKDIKKVKPKDLKSMSDDEIKLMFPSRYKQIIARLKGKIKSPAKKSPDKFKSVEDQLIGSTLASSGSTKKDLGKGKFSFISKDSKYPLNVEIDTSNKTIKIKSIQTDDYLFLMQAADKLGYKVSK